MPAGEAIRLAAGRLTVDIDTRGAVIAGFRRRGEDGTDIPLLREGAGHGGNPLQASCFPLLPFCNRVRDNRFVFEDVEHGFEPNQPWDRHYLHGDGWLSQWDLHARTQTEVVLAMKRAADARSPYAYSASIAYSLTGGTLRVGLSLRNDGSRALPFGLGLHPYFPLTPLTTLRAPADMFHTEAAEFMPGDPAPLPRELDFRTASILPRRWINNGFSGWNGQAEIRWPERQLALGIEADGNFRDYFVFMSDTRFEPGFAGDYFCFEPMTHRADAHHAAGLGGLVVLAPGETMNGAVSFHPHEIPAAVRDNP